MTDHNFTDDEIIKAMKHCDLEEKGLCKDCPLRDYGSCTEIICKYSLALINRQKVEIESLEKVLYELKMEAEMVYKQRDAQKNRADSIAKFARAKAIKEFADRLVAIYENDKIYDRPNAHTLVVTVFRNIDTLVKEMTEGAPDVL